MNGANEYYDLFKGESQQIGRLFLQFHTHARGKCFEMYLLPEGFSVKGDRIEGRENVEIYGMVSGQRGWTESYGWLHTGAWVHDFNKIVEDLKVKNKQLAKESLEASKASKADLDDNTKALLSTYK